jgi:hypothetical protein
VFNHGSGGRACFKAGFPSVFDNFRDVSFRLRHSIYTKKIARKIHRAIEPKDTNFFAFTYSIFLGSKKCQNIGIILRG